ncbi:MULTISPECIES: FAD-dependent oxidoreductase [unclassified Mycobacterium]|uniref:FAD-dependent oxidoreductase n=1 Tax=unclassified Mycobacterium TaxID=2642494 RepID=UPI0029C636F8|nr:MULTISPECIES: FAD-dependent oxidoreductase [unclassified Mycobacterium]
MVTESVQCCVVGGGPAGMMASVLLARQGIKVIVVEKHPDFLHDFRGDTIHPSTLELMHELGWAEEFLNLPHSRMSDVTLSMAGNAVTFADFRKLKVHYPFIAYVPQWDFLDFVAAKGATLPEFRLMRSTEMSELIIENDRVTGILATGPDGDIEIRADLVLAADGRNSTVRTEAGLRPIAKSAPLDVLWFQLPRRPDDDVPFLQGGRGALVSIDRGDYWQLAYAIPTDAYRELRQAGLPGLQARIASLAPALSDRVGRLDDWDAVHHLTVRVDRLPRWYRPGLLCIGDAAHAMSPAGGVGINLAVQDAVAAANLIGPILAVGTPSERDLRRVQRRRELPTRITQAFQTAILRDLYPRNLSDDTTTHVPPVVRLCRWLPALRYAVGRFIGLGVRPEHVEVK